MSKTALTRQDVELLAPAGDWDCMRAAVANGADAVFLEWRSLMLVHGRTISGWTSCQRLWPFTQLWSERVFDL